MLTTVKKQWPEGKKETTHQNLKKNYKKYKKKKLKEKAVTLLKEGKKKKLTYHQHGRFMQNFESLIDKSNQNWTKKRK